MRSPIPLSLESAVLRAAGSLSRVAGRGGGTTLPGKLLWKLDPGAIDRLAARLEQGSVLVSTEVGEGTTVLPYSVATDSKVGPRCLIGPLARMRPGSELAEAVELGNFAETKKVRIGPGTKAHHHC